jgi:hypothetical protein
MPAWATSLQGDYKNMALTRLAPARPLGGIRPAAAPAPAPAPELAEDTTDEEEAEIAEEAAAEAAAAAPVPKAATLKAVPAAPKAATLKAVPAAPKAAPAPKAAAPKAAPAPKAAAPKAAPAPRAKAPVVLGGARPQLAIEFPENLGGRIAQDVTHELFYRWLVAREESLGFLVPTKAMAIRILNAPFQFLLGDLSEPAPAPTAEDITAKGGLVRLFDVKVAEGVHFKHSTIDGRHYRNPRADAPTGQYVLINGRVTVEMKTEIEHGTVTVGTLGEDGQFVPDAA